ncbi:hypothetical protein SERLA73DRAFT_156372 [Serpula lacrymans var. lacrymans S7.3]|uniref:Fungal-type protein kinase domain-containing protein n=2 Tax=Serpula lacrymans var. lacrymans TaxID=341189 RepID=F8QE69_SERL3|nr:uncharacterized protein SERLADRAFT_412043 [Serpula lacrymans var. lacrymans S7.9]EGN93444.1 hypothetical protein SERLA73DRAFT_156372 [Serpula lacrymans var. lacrymans S7.3]EGO18820.1 hypothetical protein SERLADRAFT_412043 [Serpula lacrymans var. lacrymans S7.9]
MINQAKVQNIILRPIFIMPLAPHYPRKTRRGLKLWLIHTTLTNCHKMAMATSVSGQVPVKVLHRDGSISNSLIMDQALSDWPPLKAPEGCAPPNTHIQRGLLADWGFAAVFEDTEENILDDDDHYFGLKPGDVQKLQELVKSMLSTVNHEEEIIRSNQSVYLPDSFLRHNQPEWTLDVAEERSEGWQVDNGNHVLERTGTEPFMAVEVQNAQPGDWIQHTAHHNLQLFYYTLLAMCVLMVKPYEMKDVNAKEKDDIKKWLSPEFTSMFTRSDSAFHKYQTFGRVDGLSLFLQNYVSEYFAFMIPYFKHLCKVRFGSTLFLSKRCVEAGPPPFFVLSYASHGNVLDILGEALEEIQCNERWKNLRRPFSRLSGFVHHLDLWRSNDEQFAF